MARSRRVDPRRPKPDRRRHQPPLRLTESGAGRATLRPAVDARITAGLWAERQRINPVREQHYVQQLLDRRVDGIVITGRRRDSRPSLGPLPIPAIYVLACSEDERDMSISYDDTQSAVLAVNHLINIGRRNIAYITGPERHLSARLRRTGATEALQAADLDLPDERVMFGQWTEAWGRAAVTQLIRRDPAVDGIFCGSDQIARGVADGLRSLNKAIPEDIAIIGFDNWDVMVEGSRPPSPPSTPSSPTSDAKRRAAS